MTKVRTGPDCASTGLAQDAFAGVKHSPAFSRRWVVIAVMMAWTIATTMAYARPERRTRLLLSADLVVTAGLLLSTAALPSPAGRTRRG